MQYIVFSERLNAKDRKRFDRCLEIEANEVLHLVMCGEDREMNFRSLISYSLYISHCEPNSTALSCVILTTLLEHQNLIHMFLSPLFCNNSTKRVKRQYSYLGMLKLFNRVSCDLPEFLQQVLRLIEQDYEHLNNGNPYRGDVNWDMIHDIIPEFLCCFSDAVANNTTSRNGGQQQNSWSYGVAVMLFAALF